MRVDFSSVAPYLKDPLVLIGFFLFLAFLFARSLLKSGIIPPLGPGRGAYIIRLVLLYGFIIGALIVVFGFGLKYRELSKDEQLAAVGLLVSELKHNLYVISELRANTVTLTNAAMTVATVLRMDKFKINSGLFPNANIDPTQIQNADLYNQRYDWISSSGLLTDHHELLLFKQQNAAIERTIDRTITTVRSLGDVEGHRYAIERGAFDANLGILRRVTVAPTSTLSDLYAATAEARDNYFRIANSVVDYLSAVREYCSHDVPNKTSLGATLASERLTVRLLPAFVAKLDSLYERINTSVANLSATAPQFDAPPGVARSGVPIVN